MTPRKCRMKIAPYVLYAGINIQFAVLIGDEEKSRRLKSPGRARDIAIFVLRQALYMALILFPGVRLSDINEVDRCLGGVRIGKFDVVSGEGFAVWVVEPEGEGGVGL